MATRSQPGQAAAHTLGLSRITKRYGSVVAVDDVSLTVPPGEFLTLLGPSGAGKTTILMLIAGFVEPEAGEVFLDERRITHLPPDKRNFGMVFQGYALFPHMSVFDNIAFALKVRRRPQAEIDQRVGEALDLVQLTGLGNRLPRQLSGGQQQRVALARALVFTPDVLLLDEPLGALDRKLRTEVQVELKLLHRRVGTTFMYVTHDQEEALSMSDRIAIIRDGRFVQVGEPDELYERPATRFVADFLGESNFIRGRVIGADDGGFIYAAGGGSWRQAAAARAARNESEVLIAMRPEKIMISEEAPSERSNRVAGEIANWSYFGTTFHFTIHTAELGELVVTTPAWKSRVELAPGRRVWLSWAADASVVVADD
ncbi:MAG: ABC transporter ATP-binding protein [Alphaproteobacteria bacterium]